MTYHHDPYWYEHSPGSHKDSSQSAEESDVFSNLAIASWTVQLQLSLRRLSTSLPITEIAKRAGGSLNGGLL